MKGEDALSRPVLPPAIALVGKDTLALSLFAGMVVALANSYQLPAVPSDNRLLPIRFTVHSLDLLVDRSFIRSLAHDEVVRQRVSR